jgi:hypothetical protein
MSSAPPTPVKEKKQRELGEAVVGPSSKQPCLAITKGSDNPPSSTQEREETQEGCEEIPIAHYDKGYIYGDLNEPSSLCLNFDILFFFVRLSVICQGFIM